MEQLPPAFAHFEAETLSVIHYASGMFRGWSN
jgi:hypothetical protein